MKKTMIAGAAAIALAAPAYAELEGDLSLTYHSQYSFRGANGIFDQITGGNTDDFYSTELNVSYGLNDQWSLVAGATVGTLSNTGTDHDRYRAGVRYTSECYTLELGYQNHDMRFGGGGFDTSEIYLNLGTECPLTGGNLNLFVAHDIDLLDGTYVELSLGKDFEVNDTVGLNVTVGVAYSFDYWGPTPFGPSTDDFNHAYITVSLPIQATEALTVTPYISYSQGFDALDPAGVLEEDDEFIFGIKASMKF